ncbi:glycosyltransferase [Aquirufa sp. 2-AUSEE-184A6]|uniref:Glycosyltransferase n=1 Tax=Aquirufa novilacunae TaxID=3139305 RepID=A0ABW8STF2_9BACT
MKTPAYSLIIPVYNRPQELDELLACIQLQEFRDFEVVVIEDGSTNDAAQIIEKYKASFDLAYYVKENGGQGFARNYAFEKAKGDFFIILDSDALLEPTYLNEVDKAIKADHLDLFGGPDKDHPSFSPIQKAISYSMTSFLTTGGIRGKEKNIGGQFHPRSFNMGISRKVYEATGGFKITRMGEDIEFSIRCISIGFKSGLIPKAFIYHKRRTDFRQFYNQLHFFGRARINISRFFPKELKPVHFFPFLFFCYYVLTGLALLFFPSLGVLLFCGIIIYSLLVFFSAIINTKDYRIALLAIFAANIQLFAYGKGFAEEGLRKWLSNTTA